MPAARGARRRLPATGHWPYPVMRVAVLSDIHADFEAFERATVALAANHRPLEALSDDEPALDRPSLPTARSRSRLATAKMRAGRRMRGSGWRRGDRREIALDAYAFKATSSSLGREAGRAWGLARPVGGSGALPDVSRAAIIASATKVL